MSLLISWRLAKNRATNKKNIGERSFLSPLEKGRLRAPAEKSRQLRKNAVIVLAR
jgi:hypothetical protein